jgi:hypothetical protein
MTNIRSQPWIPPEPLFFAQGMLLFSWIALFIVGDRGAFGISPFGLAWIHAVALGWLSTTALAFLIHVLPTFTDVPWRYERLARGSLWIFQIGVLTLVTGFAAWIPALLTAGGAIVALAALAFFIPLLATARIAMQSADRTTRAVTRALLIVIAFLVVTVCVGLALAVGLRLGLSFATRWANVHAMLGVFGWLALIVAGVSVRTYNRLLGRFDRRLAHIATSSATLLGIAFAVAGMLFGVTLVSTIGGALIVLGALLYLASAIASLRQASAPHRLPREFIAAATFWLAVATALGIARLAGVTSLDGPLLFAVLVGWIGQNVNAHLMHVGVRLLSTIVIGEEDETEPVELLDRRTGVVSFIIYQLTVAFGVAGLILSDGNLLEAAGVLGILGMAAMAANVYLASRIASRRRQAASIQTG